MKSSNLRAMPMPWNKYKVMVAKGTPEATKSPSQLVRNGVTNEVVGVKVQTRKRSVTR